jgi:hypothetical protein
VVAFEAMAFEVIIKVLNKLQGLGFFFISYVFILTN